MQIWLTRCHLSVLARRQGLHRAGETPKGRSYVCFTRSRDVLLYLIRCVQNRNCSYCRRKSRQGSTAYCITQERNQKWNKALVLYFPLIVSHYWHRVWKVRLLRGFTIKINGISISIRDCQWHMVLQDKSECKKKKKNVIYILGSVQWRRHGGVCGLQYPCCPLVEKQQHFKLACLAAEGCLEPCLAAGSILSGTETLHYVVGTIINGCKESTVQQ